MSSLMPLGKLFVKTGFHQGFHETDVKTNLPNRFVEFSDTETTEEFVARDTEVELDVRSSISGGGGRVSTQIAFGHGGMNLMITGLTLRAALATEDEEESSSKFNNLAFLL